jgi:hypothetical protein
VNKAIADIKYLKREEIDSSRWDNCIQKAKNGLIYARSFYLDAMSIHWSGLILGDYDAVMPLTWNKKFGFAYLYQPPFTPQLGMFSQIASDISLSDLFITKAKKHFRFCEIHLNYDNSIPGATQLTNYVIDMEKTYGEIRRGYKKRLLENLGEAESYSLHYVPGANFRETIQLFQKLYGHRLSHIRETDYAHFEKLCRELEHRNLIFIRQVRDESGGLLNSSIFLLDDRRIYNIMSASPQSGREKRAHFYLLDKLFIEFANRKLLFDFEGSDVPGIAEFYRKFGPVNQPYPFLRYNNLPYPFRLFK